jgi:hypothetical protein
MLTPYRNPAPLPKSLYGNWIDLHQRSTLVRLGLSRQRWGLRTTASTPPLHFQEKDYPGILVACRQLALERLFAGRDDLFYVVDRKTGWCFSPPPLLLGDIVAKRCPVCKAEAGEPCDAGLHS